MKRLKEVAHHERSIITATLAAQQRLRTAGLDPISAPVEARYAWIGSVCAAVHHSGGAFDAASVSDRLDAILTHRVWGWAAFLAMMTFMFFCIFTVAQYPMDWIDAGIAALNGWVSSLLPESDFRSLLTDGVIAGVGVSSSSCRKFSFSTSSSGSSKTPVTWPAPPSSWIASCRASACTANPLSRCSVPLPAPSPALWPRAPSRTARIASSPSSWRR